MKNRTPVLILVGVIIVLTALVVGQFLFIRNTATPTRGIPELLAVAANEPDSSKWGVNFPNQYSSWKLTETNNTRTNFGGSENFDKLAADPRLVRLFAGMPFSKSYLEDRGHAMSLVDVRETGRINEKSPGACYSCKASDSPALWASMGPADFYKTPFAELGKQVNNPVGCANCHEATTMKLVVTNPALDEALKAQGRDWTTFTRQEMRSVVCANCHVEYYFKGEGRYLTFPWANGLTVEAIEKYYNDLGFKDWEHAESKAPMIKMQHPEYELFVAGSTHYNAGVACADCHMPYKRDGAAKFSDHNVRSPLLNAEAACGTCHTSVGYVVDRVNIIQKQVYDTMIATEDALVAAIDAIKAAAANPKVDAARLAEAQQLHRAAQLRWDFIAAENSMGFHNPEEALRILAAATDLARQAQLKALEAVTGAGLSGN
ncbi:MAG: ammonia-forming cytochrome c nitrite reductase subunit c552 [Anaerolineales bacterium]|nr:ammonia-forming cytochrome c nitrite reductase subunit c552 [Anaerolineales bacterium]